MDEFAAALVKEKNRHNRFFGHHTLIGRADQGNTSATPLSVVGVKDRLYVCIHGASRRAGVGVYHITPTQEGMFGPIATGAPVRHEVVGENLARDLVRLGLANKSISLRLWTCWGGGKREEDRDGVATGDGDRRSFALRVASGLKAAGRTSIEVVGYTQLVFLNVGRLKANGGHKQLQTRYGEESMINVSEENKVRFAVKAM
ncbi:hypothetical protein [Roseococcus pinisoli]|uniref:Uncharacterized protein n=1 Tax=Roseococcus pinisoli TaxID=2835040 RepID=A0ABS5QCX5_9PROT|nr:hypothetical protein [Roseococcus pinisoli]MBS7811542.1 hypothetical protein [Roseococcus pinisoli]